MNSHQWRLLCRALWMLLADRHYWQDRQDILAALKIEIDSPLSLQPTEKEPEPDGE